MKKQNSRRNKLLFIWLVVLPMVLAIVYYAVFAVDRYVSVAEVVVRQPGNNAAPQQTPGLSLLFSALNPASREETLYLRQHISSQDMLNALENRLQWHKHYAGQWRDPLYWLSEDVKREDLLRFYQRVVTVHFDELTGLLSIEVQALDPEFARQTLAVIIEESEKFVNEISHKMAREQVRFSETELANARRKYEQARQTLIEFQSENNLLDAQASAESRATIIAELESQVATERANLTGLLSTLSPNSPQVRQQRIKIASLEKQISNEKQVLISPMSGEQLNVVAARYRNLIVDSGIAEEAYKLSVAALDNARIEASKKLRTLVTVVSPNTPELSIYPRRIYNLITLLVGLLLVYGLVRFIIASIEDHRD
ncbi:ABC transporter permease [Orrella sp. JC864]|uniref:ABC transporter permease n=1 Tax=Orrella sp. JC864 TaxID=3120298 RepID=UPI0030092526